MTTYNLKVRFQNLLRPIANALYKYGITPNQLTVFTCMLSIAYAVCLVVFIDSQLLLILFPLVFFVRMALNALDGMIAKEKNMQTKLGAVLNEVGDILSDFFLIAVFFWVSNVNSHLVWGFAYLSLLAECAGAWSFVTCGQRSFAGPLGKSDRGVVLTIMFYILAWGGWRGQDVTVGLEFAFFISLILLFVTILNRIRFSLK